jgi:predicted ATPase
VGEVIENREADPGCDDVFYYYRFQNGDPVLSVRDGGRRQIEREDFAIDESILSRRKDPDQYPALAHLADLYGQIRLYREWAFGRTSVFRSPQSADLPSDRLEEDFSNLGLFLNHLRGVPKAKSAMIERLRDLWVFRDFSG